jgi:hypothetical protein
MKTIRYENPRFPDDEVDLRKVTNMGPEHVFRHGTEMSVNDAQAEELLTTTHVGTGRFVEVTAAVKAAEKKETK